MLAAATGELNDSYLSLVTYAASFPRQSISEHGDDVALHLVGAAAEGQERRRAVEPLQAAVQRRTGFVGMELSGHAEHLRAAVGDALLQFAHADLGHRG